MTAESIFEKDAIAAGVDAMVSKAEGVHTEITKARMVLNKAASLLDKGVFRDGF
jgi:calcineurin-like phosphoesterase